MNKTGSQRMFHTFDKDSLFIMPLCYHPTTLMLVDDNINFLKKLALKLTDKWPVLSFSDADEAMGYFENKNELLFRDKCDIGGQRDGAISKLRNAVYDSNRFKEILVSIIDYDMPNKTGFDLAKNMGWTVPERMSFHSYILLTGKSLEEFDEELRQNKLAKDFINKGDKRYEEQLLEQTQYKASTIFQWGFYDLARQLAIDPNEKATIFFDGNFLPLLNKHVKEHNLCELYLFDRQGSCLFLDEEGNLSWLFVRNEKGLENSINLAEKHHAPNSIVEALKSKTMILSLYEEKDFNERKSVNWEHFLLPAQRLETNDAYTKFFKLKPNGSYYYAYTNNFPIFNNNNILPYSEYLKQASSQTPTIISGL